MRGGAELKEREEREAGRSIIIRGGRGEGDKARGDGWVCLHIN